MAKKKIEDVFEMDTKLSLKFSNEDIDDTSDEDEEGNKKKKPDDTEETDPISENSLSKVKKARSKMAKENLRLSISNQEIRDEIGDAIKQVEKELNSRSNKQVLIVDNGSVVPLLNVMKPLANQVFKVINSINTHESNDYTSDVSRGILLEIRSEVAEILSAVTSSESVATVLSIRNLYATLMSANKMLHGEPNLVNGEGSEDQSDLWRLFNIFTPLISQDNSETEVVKSRNIVGDNAMTPDITLIKPIFQIFPCQELKRALKALSISPDLIGDKDDDNDFGILGAYTIPTTYRGNDGKGTLVPEEERTFEGLGYMDATDDGLPAINSKPFTWSNNGTQNVRQKCVSSYRSNNQAFVNEIITLYETANKNGIREIDQNVAFCLVLTGWLNAAFKVLVEANATYVGGPDGEVVKGLNLNSKRFVGFNNSDILFKIITEMGVGFDGEVKQSEYSSIIDSLIVSTNCMMASTIGGKFHYSEKAYKLLKDDFKSVTFETKGNLEYYIGDSKLGDSITKIVIAPKLYLPVDITVNEFEFTLPIEVPKQQGYKGGEIVHPFNFIVNLHNTRFRQTRHVAENDMLLNISIFHVLTSMTNEEYSTIIEDFLDNQQFSIGGNVYSFKEVFKSNLKYSRYWSAIAPFYNKASILGLAPMNQVDNLNKNHIMRYPLMDQNFNFNGHANKETELLNEFAPYLLGDYIRSIYNMNGDFSWIEAAIVACVIQTGYVTTVNLPQFNADSPYQYEPVAFTYTPTDGYTSVSTYLRKARAFMDSSEYGMKFTRFNDVLIDRMIPKTSARISKRDFERAFRWSTYDRGDNYYLIDNLMKDDPSVKKYLIASMDGQMDHISRSVNPKTSIMISEKEIMSSVLDKAYFDGSLLIYDTYHSDSAKISYIPESIPGTELVGYRIVTRKSEEKDGVTTYTYSPSEKSRKLVISDTISKTTIRRTLGLNDYVYITDDFYPTSVIYTLTIPTETTHAKEAAGVVHANNIKCLDIGLNIMNQFGMMFGNADGVRKMAQLIFGIHVGVNTRPLVIKGDALSADGHTTTSYGGSDYHTLLNVGKNSQESLSFVSSWRYPQYLTVPALGQFTGIPKHVTETDPIKAYEVISKINSKHFSNVCGTIIENNNAKVQTYHNDLAKQNVMIFKLRQGLNNNMYASYDYDLIVSITARKVLEKLEMED